jgi:hypothetical protein
LAFPIRRNVQPQFHRPGISDRYICTPLTSALASGPPSLHGGSFGRELEPRFCRALRKEPFAFTGMLRGRQLPIEAQAT